MTDPTFYQADGQRAAFHDEAAKLFESMAARIKHNAQSTFGGAFVIVPPQDGGEPMETLILDNSSNPAQFWMILQARSKLELDKLESQARLGQSYGR